MSGKEKEVSRDTMCVLASYIVTKSLDQLTVPSKSLTNKLMKLLSKGRGPVLRRPECWLYLMQSCFSLWTSVSLVSDGIWATRYL